VVSEAFRFLLLREVVWVIFGHFQSAGLLLMLSLWHVGNALALSTCHSEGARWCRGFVDHALA